jgi:hypothetical protein
VNPLNKMSKYSDPKNFKDIMNKLKTIPTIGGIKTLIEKTFPGWLVTTLDKYSDDYPHLTANWGKLTLVTKVKPTQIIIVDEMSFDKQHILLGVFADILSQVGFSVRAKTEYTPCEICKAAIPVAIMHAFFKESKFKCPDKWSPKCTSC